MPGSVAYVANAWRVIGKLPEAAEAMAHARFILRNEASGDPMARAEIDNLDGMIRFYQRRTDEAERLLRRAVRSFRSLGRHREVVRSEINLSLVLRESGAYGEAVEVLEAVLGRLESEEPDRIQFYARMNQALYLCEVGRHGEAKAMLATLEPLSALIGDDITRLRVLWIEGLIHFGLGDLTAAEEHFSRVRQGFVRQELSYDIALVSLDLARVYLMQGQVREVQEIASKLVPLFSGQEVYGEAYAALMLFHDAAMLSQVTLGLVENLAAYLLQSRRDPTYAFQRTS